jgi:hypothetical protein
MAGRRIGLYFAWSRAFEDNAELAVVENRYPALFEFRRILWPAFDQLRALPQGIAGFLDHVVLTDYQLFRDVVREATGNDVVVAQRVGNRPPTAQLDDQFLGGIDTLIVISLDHLRTEQSATAGEIDAVRAFLKRERNCLIVCPHHNVGVSGQLAAQEAEYAHHGDRTVPAQQRFSGLARTLLAGLGLPIENQYGLNPAQAADGGPAPLLLAQEGDRAGVLTGVTTFNLHPHLPHLAFPKELADRVEVLVRQQINLQAPPHPFVAAGNQAFNALLQLRSPEWGGQLFVGDATLWSAGFGGLDSLKAFWRNIALLP